MWGGVKCTSSVPQLLLSTRLYHLVNTNSQTIKNSIFTVKTPRAGCDDGTVGQGVAKEERVSKIGMLIRGFLNQPLTLLGTRDPHSLARPPDLSGR